MMFQHYLYARARKGFLIIAVVLSSISCGDLPPTTKVTSDSKVIITHYSTSISDPDIWFIRDTVSGACWMAVGFPSTSISVQTVATESWHAR